MPSPRLHGARRLLRLALVALATLPLVTCAEDPIGPASGGARLRIVPVFGPYARVAPLLLDRVRIIVERQDSRTETSDTIVDEVRAFDTNLNQLRIDDITVQMQESSEDLLVTLQLLSNATLLFEGSQTVTVVRGQRTPATSIPVFYQGPGANLATLLLAPQDTILSPGAIFDYRLDAFDAQGAAVTQYYVSWSLTGGPAVGAGINAAGRLTAPAVNDTFYVKVVAPNGVMDSTRAIIGTPTPPPAFTWTGAVSTDWSVAGNWSPAQVPGLLDSVVIGVAPSGRQPLLSAPTVTGAVNIAAGGVLTINGQALSTIRGFTTGGTGVLVMQNEADVVTVGGNAVFDGGSELDLLSAGGISIAGNLTQGASNSGDSYHPSGTHITLLAGASPVVSFATPGLVPGTSHFQDLAWVGTGTLTLTTPVMAHGVLAISAGTTSTISSANGSRLTAGDLAAVSPVVFNNVPVTINEATGALFALGGLTFQNMPTGVSQLVVSAPSGTITFTDVVFSTTPVAPNGFYLDVTDPTGLADGGLVVNMVNPSPASGGAFFRASNGAVVNWPASSTVTWTGAVDTFWDNAANWNPRVPVAGDDVVIPAAARFPSLRASAAVRNLTVQAGAGLDLGGGFSIVISGSLVADGRISGFAGGSLVTLSGSGQSLRGLIDANTSISGSYTLTGGLGFGQTSTGLFTLGITGSLNLAGRTANVRGSLATSGAGVLVMTQPTDSMLVARGSLGGGNVTFGGGSTTATLTGGVLLLGGSLTQSGAATSFAPSGSHKTVFSASSGSISFADPANSTFQDLDITGSGLTLQSPVRIKGTLIAAAGASAPSLTGAFLTVLTSGVNVSGLSLSGVPLVIQGSGPITQFDNVRFAGMPTDQAQLTVAHPGAATPFTFNNLTFVTQPTTGFYLRANDTDGAATGVLTINMVGASPTSGDPFVARVNGAQVNWPPTAPVKTWIGTSGASWFTATNWNPTGVPTATDNVVIPASTVTLDPCPAAGATADLTLQGGGQIIGSCSVLVSGNLTSTGTINVDVALTGAGKTLQGNFGTITMAVSGTVSLAGNTTLQGNIGTTAGDLTLGGHSLRAAGFATAGSGTLTMASASDSLIVSGATIFGGGSTAGKLTAGRLLIGGGGLTQTGTGPMFAPSGTHRTVFTELSSLTLADTVNSGFQDLDMNGQTVTAQSAVPIKGTLFASGLSFLELPNGNRVTTAGVNVSALVVETGPMLIQGGPITRFDSVTFAAQNPAGTQLTIRHPGAATPFTFTQLQFVTLPTTGLYIDATDTDGLSPLLTINMVTPNPVDPAGHILTSGGAVINWGPVAIQWNGSSSTNWSTGANWVGGIVPGASDSVVIPTATNQPVLTAPVSVGAVVVSGGTLSLNSQTLTVARTFATTGTGTLTSTTAGSLLVVAGNAVFGGGNETGLLTNGDIRVAGNFTQGTTANSFVASGLHTVFFNGTGAQTVTIASGGAASSRFQNVRVANGTGTVTLSGTTPEMVVNGTLTVASGATLTGATAVTAANVSTSTGSALTVFLLTVPAGGLVVAGSYGVNTTILTGGGTVPAITYNNLRLTGATAYTLGSNVTTAGFLDLQRELIVAGRSLTVGGDFSTTGTGILTMTNAADLVTVVGSTSFYGGDETNKLTAGILRTSNQFLQDAVTSPASFVASGGHTVEIVSQNPSGGVVNFGNPTVSYFQNLRVLFISTFVSDVVVNGNYEVNFGVSGNFFAKRVRVGGAFTKSGIGFFGPTRLTLLGGATVTGGNVLADTLDFLGTSPQFFPASTGAGAVFVANDVTAPAGTVGITKDLVIQSGIFRMGAGGNVFNVGGNLTTAGTGELEMVDPGVTLNVTGNATFAGGSTVGLLTAGTLKVSGDFTQSAAGSLTTTFAPSGTHTTVLGSAAAHNVSIGSPGAGAGGSHFQVLDVSAATGGLSLDVNMQADLLISTSTSAKLTSPGVEFTARRADVSGLILDNTRFILDEQGTFSTENFSNVTFTGFPIPTAGTTMLTVMGPGGAAAARPVVKTDNVIFQSMAVGAGNFYVSLTSTNGFPFGMVMNGSNQSPSQGGNGPTLTELIPATGVATVSWP